MSAELEDLVRDLVRHLSGSTPEELAAIEQRLPAATVLPDDYRRFMLESNGAQGWVGGSHLNLWPTEAIADRNRGYWVQRELLAFGDDGGGELYAFAAGPGIASGAKGTTIVEVPVLGPSRDRREDARVLGSTFTDFLRRLAERPRMEGLLARVDDQERLVLKSRFGLDRRSPRTITEVSDQLGLSEDVVTRIEKSALAKLRRAADDSTGVDSFEGQEIRLDRAVPASAVLDALASGASFGDVVQRFSGFDLDEPGIQAIVQEASHLAQARRLSPPAAAAFALRFRWLHDSVLGRTIHEPDPAAVRFQAEEALEELGQGNSTLGHIELRVAALYGAALTKEHETLATGSHNLPSALAAELGADDRRLLEEHQLYRQQRQGWTHDTWTLESAIERWNRVVQRVADGYGDLVDEYIDELDRRDALEDALSMLSPSGRRSLSDKVDPVDLRFEQVSRPTQPTERGLRANRWAVRRWWWHRVPLVLRGDLARRFQPVGGEEGH